MLSPLPAKRGWETPNFLVCPLLGFVAVFQGIIDLLALPNNASGRLHIVTADTTGC